MNANIIPNLADIVSMFFSAEVLVPAAIVSCFLGLCAALLRVNRDGDAMEAFIKSGGDTKTIMMIDIAGTWLIGIPLCLFAVYVLKWDIAGTYALLTMEEVARFAVTWVMFQRRKWMVSLAE